MRYSASSSGSGPGRRLRQRAGFRAAATLAAGSLLLASAGVAYADTIYNNIDGTIDSNAEIMPLNVGGPNGTTTLAVGTTGGDGKNGCDLTGQTTLTLNLISSDPSVATVTPSSVTFTSCGDTKKLTLTPGRGGSAGITAVLVSNNTKGAFDLTPAAFTVNVAAPAPSNTAPVLTISGTSTGGSYDQGDVPATICTVADAEDGASSPAPELSPITGPDAATGIGSQTATCSYTDKGGLTATSSVTYNIVDATGPQISYTLSPIAPDGDNGWYRHAVALAWTVTEGDSPSTLKLDGCTNQLITADQTATDYTCAASSSGGSAGPVSVSIKKDGTAPTVTSADADGTLGNNGWYRSDVVAHFTATDATSGPASATQSVTSSGEGAAIAVLSPEFTDNAGNVTGAGAVSQSFKIDKTAPEVSYTGATPAANPNGWYKTDVDATFTATDGVSGPLTATKMVTSSGEGTGVEVLSPAFEDLAGNVRPAAAATATFNIDKTAPDVAFSTAMADSYFGSTPGAPGCVASDGLSGLDGTCEVSGYDTTVGVHTLTATATDKAGNTTILKDTYEVKAWTLKGFYQPVDMNGVLNTVKGGSTVPAKFEVFAGDTEITDPGLMSFTMARTQCLLTSPTDDIETTATGSTSLRYDATSGQFIYNWKTPTGAGTCYQLKMTAKDGSSIIASFKLK